ncbi:MAG: cysteine desulfurase family protein [Coriobacteriia bacterium]|nr:cysteine desulfurase family protein [Coriobacteriia bacterium]
MERTSYLDYAATTPVDPRVVEAMLPYFTERFGNANSLYALGREAARALEDARERVARSIDAARPDEIIFTSGGTESDNTALIGLATAGGRSSGHIIVSAFEHHAVLEPAWWLGKHGFEVTELTPHPDGTVHPDDLAAALRDDTVLVSVMHGNNEIGTIQPIAELAAVTHAGGALFHTDAAQTLGKIEFDVAALGVDAASFSGHKIYGPKGTGVLYLKGGTRLSTYLMGGGQESKKRSGTQNVAGNIGFATALELMDAERPAEAPRLTALRDRLVSELLGEIEYAQLNAAEAPERLPHIANFVIPGVEGEAMLLHLDAAGIAVSTGSACSSGSLKPSHVLLSIGCPVEFAHGSLRVSLGRFTTDEDIDHLIGSLAPVVERLRSMNPLYEKTVAELAGTHE